MSEELVITGLSTTEKSIEEFNDYLLEKISKVEKENIELKERLRNLEKVWNICLEKEVNVADVRESILSFDMTYRHYTKYQKNYSWELLTEEEYNSLKEEILKYE